MKQTLYSQLDRLVTDRWAWSSLRTLLRACWLGISICCIWLGGSLVWGWPVRVEWLGAAALACVGAALLTLLRPRLRPSDAARRLDRRFGLGEQLATAVEVAGRNPPPGSIGTHLVMHATRTSRGLRQRIRERQRVPWVELLTLLAVALAALGLLLLTGIGGPLLGGQAESLPPLPRAADPAELFEDPPEATGGEQAGGAPGEGEQLAPGEGEQTGAGSEQAGTDGEQAGQSGEQAGAGVDPRTMQALADALRDQGATRQAAEALDRADAAGAAQELRQLADQAGQLSDSARGDLADNMREAAREIERTDPQMAEQLRDSARGLEGAGAQPSQALDELAQQLDQQAGAGAGQPGAGEQPGAGQGGAGSEGGAEGAQGDGQGGGAGNAPAGQQRPVQPERLGVDGQPVELSAEGGGQNAADPGRPGTTLPGGAGTTSGGDPRNMGATGPDPLRIPLDERDVVQEYFNP